MSTILLCATPNYGHVAPMVEIGRSLVERGHNVSMVTGSRFVDAVVSAGMTHIPLRGLANFDDRDHASFLPDRDLYRGIAQAQYDIQTIFIKTIPSQSEVVLEAVASTHPEAILVDAAFVGVAALLFDETTPRPPILAVGVLPLSQSSRDVAPYGLGMQPSRTMVGRMRNGVLRWMLEHVLFRRTQVLANQVLTEIGSPPLTTWVLDVASRFDRFLQLTVPEFEYPRSDLPGTISFVGPVLPAPAVVSAAELPSWWQDVTGPRPVVHVTQGTMDNRDLSRLLAPTIRAARSRDIVLVVSTGRDGAEEELRALVGEIPENVRIARFLPYEQLLPHLNLMITNGGYGGVQYALAHGVPLIVAGDTEDKPEVCARVTFSGVGINLKTGTPTEAAVGEAIDAVLADACYANAAAAVAASMRGHNAVASIESELREAIKRGPVVTAAVN